MQTRKRTSLNRRQLFATTASAAGLAAAGSPAQAAQVTNANSAPNLSGVSILITGASSGFGRLGAEHYARLGARVFATMRNTPRPEADALLALADQENLSIDVIDIDVLSDESVEKGVAEALMRNGGPIDVLVNNAGIGITGPIELQDMAATALAFDTNVYGCHRMALAMLPSMREAQSGVIFPVSSQLGRVIVPGAGHYSATKFALEAMSEQLAYELVPHGIDVSIIQPGGYPTKIWVNRNRYTGNLKSRSDEDRLVAYPELVARMGTEDGSGRTTDPLDVPRAIAEIISMPPGKRPLRRAVHPRFIPQTGVNEASREAQIAFLGGSSYGPWVKDVLNRD